MTDIRRFSSRRQRLDHAFLAQKLAGAKSYRRIAGYFRSSIFKLVGEEIASIPKVQVVCNSELDAADGAKTCFLGSINETRSAFAKNYEILWEDTSPDGVAWVEEEFEALWADAYPLPEAIIEEVKRIADRVEIRFADAKPEDMPAAALAESPIYRGGEQLQPWQ